MAPGKIERRISGPEITNGISPEKSEAEYPRNIPEKYLSNIRPPATPAQAIHAPAAPAAPAGPATPVGPAAV